MDMSFKDSFINNLGNFIAAAEKNVQGVLSTLGWTAEHILLKDDSAIAHCPLDPAHKMPCKSLNQHVEICAWTKDGYSREEIKCLPPDSNFAYEQSTSVVTVSIDEKTQKSILHSGSHHGYDLNAVGKSEGGCLQRSMPRTGDRASTELSRQERLDVYDFVVAKGKAVLKNSGVSLDDMRLDFDKKDEPQKPKSRLELLAEERDYKRRRQSYRAKNVHITKKSYTEVIRDVIEKQMEYINPVAGSNSPTRSEDADMRSVGDEESCDDHKTSPDVQRNRRKRDRSPSFSSERRRSRHSPSHHSKYNYTDSPTDVNTRTAPIRLAIPEAIKRSSSTDGIVVAIEVLVKLNAHD